MRTQAYSLIAVLVLMSCPAFCGVELQKTPIQDAMYAQMYADEWDKKPAEPTVKEDVREESDSRAKPEGRKSVVKAGVFSAILPGAGEYYVGNRGKARVFFAAEALTWLGYLSFHTYGDWKRDDAINYGNIYAGASLDDKDDDFLDMVGFYTSTDQYNTAGRVGDPDRPYLADTPENHWYWQSTDDQATFRELKNRSNEAYHRAEFMIGVAVVARIVSVIDAVRDAARHNRQVENQFAREDNFRLKFDVNPFGSSRQVSLTLLTPF